MFLAKLRQLRLTAGTAAVTLPYPAVPHPAPAAFRGLPSMDVDLCVGCGACAHICPARLFTLTPNDGGISLQADFSRCIYCARCSELCPTGAIAMTDRFETATGDLATMRVALRLEGASCPSCGRPLGLSRRMVSYLAATGESRGVSEAMLAFCPTCKRRENAARLKGGRKHD